jgi:hypothetical protein
LDDQALSIALREQGLARARLFTWEGCAEATAAMYKKLAG